MRMRTLEHLAGWLAFGFCILAVYGLLSMFFISPSHAFAIARPFVVLGDYATQAACEQQKNWRQGEGRCIPPPSHARDIPEPSQFDWIDSLDASEQPTFARIDRGVDVAETTDDGNDGMCDNEVGDGKCPGAKETHTAVHNIPLPRERPYVSGLGANPEYGYRPGVQKYVPNTRPRVPDIVYDSKDQEYLER